MKITTNLILSISTFIVLQIFPAAMNAQLPNFQKVYPCATNESTRDVVQTSDGYLVAAMKTKPITGDSDIYIVKLNTYGDTMWTKTYGGAGQDYPHCILDIGGGNYFVLGFTTSRGAGAEDMWLMQINSTGDTAWTKTYGGPGIDSGHEIISTSDGNYMIAGPWNGNACLIKISPVGNVIWTQNYGGVQYETAGSVKQCLDGGYIFVGQTFSYGAGSGDIWLVKTDAIGVSTWTKTFGGTNFDEGKFVLANTDGTYTLCGNDSSAGGHGDIDVRVIHTDANGIATWDIKYGGVKKDICKMIQHTSDGGYVVVGASRSPWGWSNPGNNPDMWIVKLDAIGDTLWTRHFGSWNHDHGYALRETSDGGIVAVGHQEDLSSITHMMVIKMDGAGNFPAAVQEFAKNNSISIYPNPSTDGMVNIDMGGDLTGSTLMISNEMGQEVFSEKIEASLQNRNELLNIGANSPGIYFVTLRSEKYLTTKKLILK